MSSDETNLILEFSQEIKSTNATQDADVLQSQYFECLGHRFAAGFFRNFVHFGHHINKGYIKEHATGQGKNILRSLKLAKNDATNQAQVASAGRKEIVDQSLTHRHSSAQKYSEVSYNLRNVNYKVNLRVNLSQ